MNSATFPLHLIPLLPLLGAAVNLLVGRKLKRDTVSVIAVGAVGISCLLALHAIIGSLYPLWKTWHAAEGVGVAAPAVHETFYTWIQSGGLRIDLAFLLDPLSAVMILTVTFVGFLIHVYSTGYMAHDPDYARFFGYLNLFTGAMLILVLGDSLPVMFIGWEGVGLCSYLLIGFWFDKEKNAYAGRKAFVVNRIGDFGFLLGIFVLFLATHAVDFEGIRNGLEALKVPAFGKSGPPLATVAALLLFVGACGKSAQIPLYVWLPDAMAGPTPVSALIHAATMVTAGVYMVARMSFLYMAAPQAMMVVAGVGAATAFIAALIGFAQTDIKKVLAYSTISQLGFMFVGVGTAAFTAGIFHLFTHAFFKAGLFLGAGSVMHAMGDRTEIMEMGGLRKKLRYTHATFLIYCLAIAGILPFAGFFSKDEILLGAYVAHLPGWPVWYGRLLWVVLSVAAMFTAFYMWRLYFLVFSGKSRADEHTRAHIHESPAAMTGPLVVLAVGATVLGFLGLPHLGGLTNFIAEWLQPALAPAPEHHVAATEIGGLMGVALVAGLAGIGIAAFFYSNGPGERIRRVVAAIAGLRKVVANKFYVDEAYDFVIVRPFKWLATATFNVIDRFVIDLLLVNGSAFVVDVSGRIARWWQNGNVQRGLAAIVIGAAGIFWLTGRPTPATIKVSGSGTERVFVADVGAGPMVGKPDVEWDFNGDGTVDARTPEARWSFAPGEHEVTLKVTDQSTGKVEKVRTKVTVAGMAGGGGR